jgi:hypothetical protein
VRSSVSKLDASIRLSTVGKLVQFGTATIVR